MSIPFWDEYARVQNLVELGRSRDEQLDALLNRYVTSNHKFDLHDSRRRLKNLSRNLMRKDRCRSTLLKRFANRTGTIPELSPVVTAAAAEARMAVRLAAGDDWPLLRATIDGEYAALAQTMHMPVGTLKARVFRSRRKLAILLANYFG
jgi:hypothetical protein